MVMFCQTCRGRITRVEREWKHEKESSGEVHEPAPIAARRCRLFDPDVVGLPGYDRALVWLVRAEKSGKSPAEAWRIGLYVFDGRIRGVFRYTGAGTNTRPGALFHAPVLPGDTLLRHHPVVKARLAALSAAAKRRDSSPPAPQASD